MQYQTPHGVWLHQRQQAPPYQDKKQHLNFEEQHHVLLDHMLFA